MTWKEFFNGKKPNETYLVDKEYSGRTFQFEIELFGTSVPTSRRGRRTCHSICLITSDTSLPRVCGSSNVDEDFNVAFDRLINKYFIETNYKLERKNYWLDMTNRAKDQLNKLGAKQKYSLKSLLMSKIFRTFVI